MRGWWWLLVVGACGFSSPGTGGTPSDAATGTETSIDSPIDGAPIDGPRTDWWDARWQHRRPIELDNTKVTALLSGFPVLVTLTPTTVSYANIRPNGDDLRFISEDNTVEYVYEIDTYVANGTSYVWVRIPTLMPTGPKPILWLYYNNPAATPVSSGAMLWGPSYVSVHHLGLLTDATNKPHTASAPTGNTPAAMTGQIGSGRKFDGTDDYLLIAGEPDYSFTTTLSASAWVQVTQLSAQFQAVITKGDSTWRMQRSGTNNFMQFGTTVTVNQNLDGSQVINNGAWHHIAIVMDGTKKYLYVDGAEDANIAHTTPIDTSNQAVRFGMNPESTLGGARYWNGMLDEIRISSTPRTAAWIRAEHMTVTDPNFAKIKAEQAY